jgi:hypothetical protein
MLANNTTQEYIKMIKSKVVLLTAALALTSTVATAGLFSSTVTSGWDTKQAVKYKVETYGFDLRVYEWTPEGNPDITCTTAFGEKGPIGLQCFPTKVPTKDRLK